MQLVSLATAQFSSCSYMKGGVTLDHVPCNLYMSCNASYYTVQPDEKKLLQLSQNLILLSATIAATNYLVLILAVARHVTVCNGSCNLSPNVVARQIARKIAI